MAKTRSRSRLWAMVPLAVLVFACWQTVTILSREPAFNRSLQVEAAGGGTLPPLLDANFDQADYYYWIGFRWYQWSLAMSWNGEELTTSPDDEVRAGFHRSRDAASESLRFNPGNAQSWMLLARGRAALGDIEGALGAWQTSYDLAPRQVSFAFDRLYFLTRLISNADIDQNALRMINRATVLDDLATIRRREIFVPVAEAYAMDPSLRAILEGILPE